MNERHAEHEGLDRVIAAALEARSNPVNAAAQEARITKEARMPSHGELSAEQVQGARDRLKALVDAGTLTIAKAAKRMGYSPVTASQWLSGHYAGDVSNVARKAAQLVEQIARGEDATLPSGFIVTSMVEQIFGIADMAQKHARIGIFTAPSGVSKSMTAQAIVQGAVAGIPLAHHVRITSAHNSASQFLRLLAIEVGSRPISGTKARMLEGIIARIRDTRSMIILDDAQRLQPACDEIILDLCKLGECPVLVLDTDEFDSRVIGEGVCSGQFERLVIARYNAAAEQAQPGGAPLCTVDDVVRFARSMGLRLAGDAAERLTEISCHPGTGGLGRVAMLLAGAALVMRREGKDRVELRHVAAAWLMSRGKSNSPKYDHIAAQARRRVAAVA